MAARKLSIRKPAGIDCPLSDSCVIRLICRKASLTFRRQPQRIALIPCGHIVFRDNLNGIVIVRSGLLTSLVPTPKGNQFVFSLVGEGYVIGSELAVVSGDSPGDIFVAVSDAEVCLLSVESVKAALQEDPALLKEITIAVVNNGIAFIQQSWILQGMSTTSRVKRFFSVYLSRFSKENQSEVVVPISHRLLALIINAERASVTRAIKQLHDSGLLIKRSKSIVLKTKLWTPDVENSDDIWGPSLSIEPT